MSAQPPLDFGDGKAPEAFRTIGEVAQALGLRQHVLRYWEEQFPMLRPLKRAGGRRYYRAEDIRLVSEINRLLYREGFTIRGARQALGGKGTKAEDDAPSEPARPGEELERTEALTQGGDLGVRLRALRDGLAESLARC
ncbi:MAG: MerR family transcriptional regulator [Novosphingobium sp.]